MWNEVKESVVVGIEQEERFAEVVRRIDRKHGRVWPFAVSEHVRRLASKLAEHDALTLQLVKAIVRDEVGREDEAEEQVVGVTRP